MVPTKTTSIFLMVALVFASTINDATVGFSDHFCRFSCPHAESMITKSVNQSLVGDLRFAAGLIRLQFHDCFVEGCDGSVLLDGADAEKTAAANDFLSDFEVVDAAKTAVQAICPGLVSCADILAYAARDSTVELNGTGWKVQGGRNDGVVSSAATAEAQLPSPDLDLSGLIASFARRGLSKDQMVILSGSHTVGVDDCEKIQSRLYNFNNTNTTDPSLNTKYAAELKNSCPQQTFNQSVLLFMDVITLGQFDSNFYKTLQQRKGLFTSDHSLFEDPRTTNLVQSLTRDSIFEPSFGQAMRPLAAVGIKTSGQIRKDCRKVNS
ncbi:hypothetical protein Mapa_012126 [Marchantia paleacea]|nr:hypothetical protein Mapa_012126 [Marchantia paleacea]